MVEVGCEMWGVPIPGEGGIYTSFTPSGFAVPQLGALADALSKERP